MSLKRPAPVIFVHSSNEMFGADRILLQVVDSLVSVSTAPIEVWLPNDVSAATDSLGQHLTDRGVTWRTVSLPILRRRYITPSGIVLLVVRSASLFTLLRQTRPSVLYCTTSAGLPAAPIARFAGCRRVVLHQQEIWAGRERIALALLAAFCTSAVAISNAARASLIGPVRSRSIAISNAIDDIDVGPASAAGSDAMHPLNFLIASRWNSWKGHKTLLAAWDTLDPPPGRLVILGSPPAEGLGVDVRALVDRLRNASTVEVVGQVADITEWVDTSDVVIVPSDSPEPFGLVAIEAFRRGRPVIASRRGGIGEIVTDGSDGVLFDNGSVAGLRDALRSIDHGRVAVLGANARKTFERQFSLPRFNRSFNAVWTALGLTRR